MRLTRIAEDGAASPALDRVDTLLADAGAPVTARVPWLQCYLRAYGKVRPVVVTVEDDGTVIAAACLGRVDGPVVEWTALGHAVSDYSMFPAVDDDAARRLAAAVAQRVDRGWLPWRLRLEQFPEGDPVQRHLCELLGNAHVRRGIPALRLTIAEPRELNAHVSKSARRSRARGRNRLERDGHDATMICSRDADVIGGLLERAVALRRGRDHQVRGFSDLDDPQFARFHHEIMTTLAGRGELEICAVLVGDLLIGYLLSFVDGTSYRTWDGRVDSEWTEYAAGWLCNSAALESALADRRITTFDWMRGEQEYKKSATDHVAEYQHLHAWSSPAVRQGFRVVSGVARRARGVTIPFPRPALAGAAQR